jgi:hypothetical protein
MDRIVSYAQSLGPLEAVGVLGFLVYIGAFAAVQWGLMDGNAIAYSLANVTSSVLVSIGLVAEFNLSAAMIQGSVIAIGTTGLALRLARMRRRGRRADRVLGATLEPAPAALCTREVQ